MKRKIIFLLVLGLVVYALIPSVTATVEVEGSIKAEILPLYIGIVKPIMNLTENQTLDLNVDESNGNLTVNETLKINIEKIGDLGRKLPFLLPRSIFVQVIIIRKDFELTPLKGILDRIFVSTVFDRVDVIPGFGKELNNLAVNIPMNYKIKDTTTTEDFTMHVFAMGSLPGNNGDNKDKILPPIIGYQMVNLKVNYLIP